MTIFLGADHAGYELKGKLSTYLTGIGCQVVDCGATTLDNEDDYPRYAYTVASQILGADDADLGLLICGSGQGMSIAANRVNGIRAALAWNLKSAKSAREDDNANVLVLPARYVSQAKAEAMVDMWMNATFKADPKYLRRLNELEELYG